jgi:hypothetical protein
MPTIRPLHDARQAVLDSERIRQAVGVEDIAEGLRELLFRVWTLGENVEDVRVGRVHTGTSNEFPSQWVTGRSRKTRLNKGKSAGKPATSKSLSLETTVE